MKTIKIMLWMAALTLAWGCSSSDDDSSSHFTFTPATAPAWDIDWTWNDPAPDWQEPSATQYECSMNMLVDLNSTLRPLSTDADIMAMFINGTCRGISRRNVYPDGKVVFLLLIKGASQETGEKMELRYYSAGSQQIFVDSGIPPFTPNNLMDEAFSVLLFPQCSSTKYPLYTELTVMLPDVTPFTVTEKDIMAVFVGDECRGICSRDEEELFPGWKGDVFSRETGETAHVRYYSASDGGIYIFNPPFKLNNLLQQYNVTF
ncbi:MAG: hypothetical protein J5545_06075 [Bacteroidaceae bacterium]|nr:hypothetical protein [Bacteroidaceae bacterium]